MTTLYMVDTGNDASEQLQSWIKKERGVLNRDITRIEGTCSLADSIKDIDFEGQKDVDVYVPTLWEGTEKFSAWGIEIAASIKASILEATGTNIRFYFPFSKLQLIDMINDKPDERLHNGDCAFREIPEEQCGMCLDCIEKFLAYKLNDIPTEEAFMEDPFDGHESKERLYNIMAKLSGSTFTKIDKPLKQEISIGALMVECFFRGILPSDISNTFERRFQVLLIEPATHV